MTFKARFETLADKYERETRYLSSPAQMACHPAYVEITEMGPAAIRLILLRLQSHHGGHWFWALAKLTGENPVPSEDAGRMRKMARHWVLWGQKNGWLD